MSQTQQVLQQACHHMNPFLAVLVTLLVLPDLLMAPLFPVLAHLLVFLSLLTRPLILVLRRMLREINRITCL